ncbi:NADPH-dependent oxidoreductase [Carboxylicivirga mesophila]|uniref:NADPH-dependent oxidoreductase n=1 Tax=Carboxylicivirga mesophila TaxID=1166478 RepID=A0ABS5KB02_9BACT|nr:NADPH-dependent oxidoreductase [Carboxylicivirga mesophila]MBS2212032.1 NADPH-dependent oxidoreductase [Carboxylicivirga mesophila]
MIDILKKHKTIRQYTDKPISEELLNEILEAGVRASTTGNMQVYSVVVTQDEAMKEKLAPCHFNQPMVKQAPVTLTFCADFNRFNQWCRQRNAEPGYDNFLSFMTAAIDALLVAQNVCVAAETKGLGICYLGTTTYLADKIIDVLELPKGVVPVTTVTIGYPDENPEQVERLPLDAVVHYETYKDYTTERIDALYEAKEELAVNKAFVAENEKETLAQVFTDVRYKKADNEHFSSVLLQVLKNQGFM